MDKNVFKNLKISRMGHEKKNLNSGLYLKILMPDVRNTDHMTWALQ